MLLILLKVVIHPFFIDTVLRILIFLWKALKIWGSWARLLTVVFSPPEVIKVFPETA